jgi:hypothetical protein
MMRSRPRTCALSLAERSSDTHSPSLPLSLSPSLPSHAHSPGRKLCIHDIPASLDAVAQQSVNPQRKPHTLARTRTHAHARTHMHTHAHTRTHTHTHAHARTRTHTHAHARAASPRGREQQSGARAEEQGARGSRAKGRRAGSHDEHMDATKSD